MTREEVIAALNQALTAELGAVELYGVHAEAIQQPEVAQAVAAILDVERNHARNLAARIRELGGEPAKPGGAATVAGRAAGAASSHGSTAEMLRLELSEEQNAIKHYAVVIADIMDDPTTVDMLEEHILDEMQHARWMKARILALEKAAG